MSKKHYHYGPTIVLLVVFILALIGGPYLVRQLSIADEKARLDVRRDQLDKLSGDLSDLRQAFRLVSKVVNPSVVHIAVVRQNIGAEGTGSGWVFSEDGYIVTNYHVVRGAEDIRVKFADRSSTRAVRIGEDPKTDIAVLRIVRDGLIPAKRVDLTADAAKQGDIVFAFGSPFQYDFSMTQGIISGMNRSTGVSDFSRISYQNFIQTDAAINPGNSGGPLTDIRGHVIGMNTLIPTRTGEFSGIGLAIPIDLIEEVVEQLIENGEIRRGYLGVRLSTETVELENEDDAIGIMIQLIERGGPAASAGMQSGDVVVALDGASFPSVFEFRRLIARMNPGQVIKLTVLRGDETIEIEVRLGEQPDELS